MKARTLSKREGEEVITIIRNSWPKDIELGKAKGIKSIECDEDTQILILERIKAIKTNEGIFPFLDQEETLENFPKIEIDLGAIKYVCNGADVMRPGIKIFNDEFKKGDIVAIQEEKYKKYIAVGIAAFSSSELEISKKGMAIKNNHYVGDKAWEEGKKSGV